MKLSTKQQLFTKHIGSLIHFATLKGYGLTFGDAFRDSRVFGQVGEKKSYSSANSNHKQRLAVDFNLFVDGEYITDGNHPAYQELGIYWESLDKMCAWGGRFKDANHFSFEHNGVK